MKPPPEGSIADYFTRFLPRAFGRQFIDALPSKTEIIQFSVTGETGVEPWFVSCPEERIVTAKEPAKPPRCDYRFDFETFREIVAGRLSPQKAFFTRRLKLRGDLLFAIQLGALLEHFFREHPYECS